MNILMTIYNPLNTGGAEASVYNLSNELEKRGHNISILSTEEYPGIKTYRMKKLKKYPFFWYHKNYVRRIVSGIIKKDKIDVVHSHCRRTSPGAILAAKENNIPSVAHFRDYWFACPRNTMMADDYRSYDLCSYREIFRSSRKARIPWDLYKWRSIKKSWNILESADVKIAVSSAVEKVLRSIGINDGIVIPNGRKLSHSRPPKDMKKRLGLKGTIVTYIGLIDKQKGILNMMDVMPELLRKNTDMTFLIVGDGPLEGHVSDMIRNLGLRESIVLAGRVPYDVTREIYSVSDIILLPSIWQEPFSGIPIEAASAKKPIVASRTGGTVDSVIDKKTGFLLDPFDLNAWKNRIEYLTKNEKARKIMGEAAYRFATENFDIKLIAGRVEDEYRKVVK